MGSPELRTVLDSLGPGSVVVFDLDATLLWSGPRHLRIAREFAALRPQSARAVRKLKAEDFAYEPSEALAAAGLRDDKLLRQFRQFWSQRYFTSAYALADRPQPGAVDYVHACHSAGARVVYLTGRDEPNMGEGTRRSLLNHAFPLGFRTQLLMKPKIDQSDRAWKLQAMEQLEDRGRVAATFENEPGNANLFAARFPDAVHFLLDTVHSADAEPPSAALVRTPDFVL